MSSFKGFWVLWIKRCLKCNKEFTSSRPKSKKKFCSNLCGVLVYRKAKREEMRPKVLTLLGGKCNACGELDVRLLSIDHIYDDRKTDKYCTDKLKFYKFILGFPEQAKKRYQILCYNHNAMKSIYSEDFKRLFKWAC